MRLPLNDAVRLLYFTLECLSRIWGASIAHVSVVKGGRPPKSAARHIPAAAEALQRVGLNNYAQSECDMGFFGRFFSASELEANCERGEEGAAAWKSGPSGNVAG